jgi:hypothetical protein
VHKDFSAKMVDYFQWPGLYGIMSWFPYEPWKISGQQTLVRWYEKIKSYFKCFKIFSQWEGIFLGGSSQGQ